jgi:hypothetical protein
MRLVLIHSRDLDSENEKHYDERIRKFVDGLHEIRDAVKSGKWSENFFAEELRRLKGRPM